MVTTLALDYESKSDRPLTGPSSVGLHNYANDLSTRVILAAWFWNDGPVERADLASGAKIAPEVLDGLRDPRIRMDTASFLCQNRFRSHSERQKGPQVREVVQDAAALRRARARRHYAANREKVLAAVALYQRNNPDHHRAWRLGQGAKTTARDMVHGARSRARAKGVPFDPAYITVDRVFLWLLGEPSCACCAAEFDFTRTGKNRGGPRACSPTLDRLLGERGYVPGNVAVICWACNKLKGASDIARLRKLLAWLEANGAGAAL